MSDIKLNTYIEWTEKDRAKGECPVPAGSDVTVWFGSGLITRNCRPEIWIWHADANTDITAYLVHSVPREPIVRWMIVSDEADSYSFETEDAAEQVVLIHGGRVVKLVEEMG